MKIIKCNINKTRTDTHTSYKYPESWDPSKIHVVAYEHGNTIGNVKEGCIAIIKDDNYAEELLKEPDVTEITEDEANTLGDKWRPQRVIVDEK